MKLHHLPQLPLTAKLAAINLLLVGALVTVFAVAWTLLPADTHDGDTLRLVQAQRTSQEADMLHDAMRADLLSAMLQGVAPTATPTELMRISANHTAQFRRELLALDRNALPASLSAQIDSTRAVGMAYADKVEALTQLALADQARAIACLPEFEGVFEEARVAMAQLTQQLADELVAEHERASAGGAHARRALVLAALFTVTLGWVCVTLIARSIRRSLVALRAVASDIATGQLDQRSQATGRDEVGQLARAINQMADELQRMITQTTQVAERGDFGARLVRAMDMADSEPQAHQVVARAMAGVSPDHAMELLLADASGANLERAASHPGAGAPGCTVQSSFACAAVRSGHTLRFADSHALGACPKLWIVFSNALFPSPWHPDHSTRRV